MEWRSHAHLRLSFTLINRRQRRLPKLLVMISGRQAPKRKVEFGRKRKREECTGKVEVLGHP
jgi:hypothetical protein